jgi:SMC interacting uncharacterized protein involved in chromosome segregation
MGLPAAWEATANNQVTRHYTPKAGMTAEKAAEQVRVVDHKVRTLSTLLGTSKTAVLELEKRVGEIAAAMRGPESELATANQALIDLQKRNDNLIKQCRMWKQRTEEAKQTAERYETELNRARQQAETPNFVTFIRQRTPGDSVRHLAGEVMKHAEGNMELAGLAVALRMVAADVDSLPQGAR